MCTCTSQLCPERAGLLWPVWEGSGRGGVERRIEQELAEAERSGAAGDRRSGPLLEL